MQRAEFEQSLQADTPPSGLSPELRALWLEKRGDWEGAHRIAQDLSDARGARIHAYLHRKEGDLSNARYWYRRAGCREAQSSLEEEWQSLVRAAFP